MNHHVQAVETEIALDLSVGITSLTLLQSGSTLVVSTKGSASQLSAVGTGTTSTMFRPDSIAIVAQSSTATNGLNFWRGWQKIGNESIL